METKTCLFCSAEIKGRYDKKFCDDQCRAHYNNRLKSNNVFVRNVNIILKRNRKVLAALVPERGKKRIRRRRLSDKGYNFDYHTHTERTKGGRRLTYCYEFGLQDVEKDVLVVMKSNGY